MAKEIDVVFIKEKKGFFKLGETKSVKPGYALNYLLPYQWAVRHTRANQAKIDAIGKEKVKHQQDLKVKAEELHATLNKKSVLFSSKAQEEGKLYGSISINDIVTKVNKEFDLQIDKYDIQLPETIKQVGEYTVSVNIHQDIKTKFTVTVEAEEEKKKEKSTSAKGSKGSKGKEESTQDTEIKTYADEDMKTEEATSPKDIETTTNELF
jgi:large subunit ribosomal protein L9